jgi:hypothetical protein
MTSTYLSYRIYSADLAKSLQRTAAEPANANDQKYFEANIGKVKSVDDFLNNYRLFTYAMKAYGLQDLGNAKALMKQVLESNLSDTNSVANRLNDSRYKAFAKAFNFTTKGGIASTGQVQTNAQQQDLLAKMNPLTSETAGLETSLSNITSVDSFESSGLYSRVLSAYGLDPKTTFKYEVSAAMTSDLSNPLSFANRPGNDKLRALAEDFNFAPDGSVGSQKLLQSPQNITTTTTAYMSKIGSTAAAQAAAATESAYYTKTMPGLTSVDQILKDPRLLTYVKTAFGLDPNITTDQLRGVLTSDLLDPKSAANTYGIDPKNPPTGPTAYQLVASAFSIGTDGKAWDHSTVMTSTNIAAATKAYTAATAAIAAKQDTATAKTTTTAGQVETDYFNSKVPTLKSSSALLSDSRLVAYVRSAFDLPAATLDANGKKTSGYTDADIGNILTSNLLDLTSAANTMGANARKLATSFNFAPDGLVYDQRSIQSAANVKATTTAYQSLAGTSANAKAAAQAETDYYTSTLPSVKSVDDLLSDKRIVAYLTKAYNLPTTSTGTLRQVLTSNLLDPKSKANVLGGGYQTLAAAFDISPDGTITHAPDRQVQTKTGLAATHIAFLDQSMETEAGTNQGDGVRLALYFKRVAPTITSAYGILADKALTSVVQTMLGLSSTSSKADIDSQARFITSKVNLADFKNPAKLDKLVARFTALYDLNNNSSSGSSSSGSLSTSSLFGG